MSYRIDYNPENRKKYPTKKSSKTNLLIFSLVAITVIFTTFRLCKNDTIKAFLLPGDPQVTSSAVSKMIDDVQNGETIKNAVTAFCLEILQNA